MQPQRLSAEKAFEGVAERSLRYEGRHCTSQQTLVKASANRLAYGSGIGQRLGAGRFINPDECASKKPCVSRVNDGASARSRTSCYRYSLHPRGSLLSLKVGHIQFGSEASLDANQRRYDEADTPQALALPASPSYFHT